MTMPSKPRFEIDFKMPFTWLLSMIGALICALVWTGWQAKELYDQIGKAIAVGQQVMAEQTVINKRIIDLDVATKMHGAQIDSLQNSVDRLEKR